MGGIGAKIGVTIIAGYGLTAVNGVPQVCPNGPEGMVGQFCTIVTD